MLFSVLDVLLWIHFFSNMSSRTIAIDQVCGSFILVGVAIWYAGISNGGIANYVTTFGPLFPILNL